MVVDHIGYLVKNIEASIKTFESIGYKLTSGIYKDDAADENNARNVNICFMQNGDTRIELVSPIDESSDVFSTLKRQGEGPYHICYRVDSLEETTRSMKKEGWLILKRPAKAIAFDYNRVVFMFKPSVGVLELVELEG